MPQAVAVKVSSIMKKYDDVVQSASEAAIKDLKKMLVANKKDKNACILIATKVYKIDREDKDALEILKDVPVDVADLLAEKGDAGKYISEVKAKLIADALAKDKFTEKDWESLPGTILNVNPRQAGVSLGWVGKKRMVIIPCPTDKWKAGKESPFVDWRGGNNISLSLVLKNELAEDVETFKAGVVIELDCKKISILMKQPHPTRIGSIRVRIYEVVPIE